MAFVRSLMAPRKSPRYVLCIAREMGSVVLFAERQAPQISRTARRNAPIGNRLILA